MDVTGWKGDFTMDPKQYLANLQVPTGVVDAVLDTDTYNEIDDQFALAYMFLSPEKFNLKAIYAAPFFNSHSTSPKDGMERSYDEIMKLLGLLGREDYVDNVYKGSEDYLVNEAEPQESEAARHLVSLASQYSPENPLYVVAIGADADGNDDDDQVLGSQAIKHRKHDRNGNGPYYGVIGDQH